MPVMIYSLDGGPWVQRGVGVWLDWHGSINGET